MVKYFPTVSTHLDTETHEEFMKYCKDCKKTPHTLLKEYVFDLLGKEKKIESKPRSRKREMEQTERSLNGKAKTPRRPPNQIGTQEPSFIW